MYKAAPLERNVWSIFSASKIPINKTSGTQASFHWCWARSFSPTFPRKCPSERFLLFPGFILDFRAEASGAKKRMRRWGGGLSELLEWNKRGKKGAREVRGICWALLRKDRSRGKRRRLENTTCKRNEAINRRSRCSQFQGIFSYGPISFCGSFKTKYTVALNMHSRINYFEISFKS